MACKDVLLKGIIESNNTRPLEGRLAPRNLILYAVSSLASLFDFHVDDDTNAKHYLKPILISNLSNVFL